MTSETDRPQKITFADMRDMGVRGLLIYCSDYKCSHLITVSGDRWPDNRVTDILRTLLGSIWRWTGAFFLLRGAIATRRPKWELLGTFIGSGRRHRYCYTDRS